MVTRCLINIKTSTFKLNYVILVPLDRVSMALERKSNHLIKDVVNRVWLILLDIELMKYLLNKCFCNHIALITIPNTVARRTNFVHVPLYPTTTFRICHYHTTITEYCRCG